MDQISISNTLSVDDYQQVLTSIDYLGECQTREELNHLLKTMIMPLLNCCGMFYMYMETGQSQQLLGDITHSSVCEHKWKCFLNIALQAPLLPKLARLEASSLLASNTFYNLATLCQQCSEIKNCYLANHGCSVIALFDAPTPTIVLYMCRLKEKTQTYDQRDCLLLKILHATLLQTLKAVIFQEQYQNLQKIMSHFLACNKQEIAAYKSSISINSKPLFITDKEQSLVHRQFILQQFHQLGLSKRELEITELIYQGLSTRHISLKLNLSYHTVRNHIKHIYTKVGVSSRSELLTWSG